MTNILGTNSNEQLFGTSLADVIHGLFGDDTIYSRQANDTLKGNNGNDQLFGEDGLDKTTFRAISSNAGSGFSKTNEFAVVSNDSLVERSISKIVFSRGTGNLFCNENGADAGLGSGGHFATLTDVDNLAGWQFKINN